MGVEEDTCYDEYWVLYVSEESLNFTPETNKTKPEEKNWKMT